MTLRLPLFACLVALLTGSARAEPRSCKRDKDCPGEQVCERNQCVSPSQEKSSSWGGTSREQEASRNAGMALQYTKNTWPISLVDRPLVVAPGMTEMQLGITKDISADSALGAGPHPLGADLYARFGVSDRIHAGLDGIGVCFTDCGGAGFFRGISVGAGYAVVATHDTNFVPALTAAIYNFASGIDSSSQLFALQPGFLWGWRMGDGLQLFASGGLVLGVIGRDNAANPDILAFHVEPRFMLGQRLSLGPYVGYSLPLKTTELYQVPLGVNLLFVADRAFDLGGSFEFSDIAKKTINTGIASFETGGFDNRMFRIFATIRL